MASPQTRWSDVFKTSLTYSSSCLVVNLQFLFWSVVKYSRETAILKFWLSFAFPRNNLVIASPPSLLDRFFETCPGCQFGGIVVHLRFFSSTIMATGSQFWYSLFCSCSENSKGIYYPFIIIKYFLNSSTDTQSWLINTLCFKSKWVQSGNITITYCRPSMAPWGRATWHQHPQDTRKTTKAKQPTLSSSSRWLQN